jgi:hypothetical protein
LDRLRTACLRIAPRYTWTAAGVRLLDVYREVIIAQSQKSPIAFRFESRSSP